MYHIFDQIFDILRCLLQNRNPKECLILAIWRLLLQINVWYINLNKAVFTFNILDLMLAEKKRQNPPE